MSIFRKVGEKMSDGRVIIDTALDTHGLEKGLSNVGSIAKLGLKATTIAIGGIATAVGGLSGAAIKVGSDFEAGMSKVQAISGATGEELIALTEKAKEMGAKTKFSAGESAQAFQYMAQAGWKTGDMLNGIEGIMNLAAASGEDLASVSDIVTDALTAFGLKASDSAHFADVLAKASSNSNTNVGLMGNTFQYVAPVAGALGYSVEDCAVAIGLMANAGIKGEKSGTALRSIFTNLISPTDTVAGAMERLGISATNTDGTMKPLNQLLSEMRGSFSGLTDEQKASEAAAIAGKEAMSGLLSIVNASDEDFNNLTSAIADSDGAAQDMATTMQDNLSGKLEQLGGGLETLGLTAYEKFQGPMKKAIDTAIEAVDSLVNDLNNGELGASVDRIAEGFGNLIEAVAEGAKTWLPRILDCLVWIMDNGSNIISALSGIGAGLLTFNVVSIISNLIGVLNGTAKAIGVVAKAQAALDAIMAMSTIGWIVIAIAAVVTALVVLWNTNEGFRNAVIGVWNNIKDVALSVWGGICDFFTNDIPNAWNGLIGFFTGAGEWVATLWNNINQGFIDGWNAIVAFFTETIPAWFQSIWDYLATAIPSLMTSIGEWFAQLPYQIGYNLGYGLGMIIQWGIDIWNSFTETCVNVFTAVTTWFSQLPGQIWGFITDAYLKIVQWGINTWNSFTETCVNVFNSVVTWFSQLPGQIWNFLCTAFNNIVTWGANTWNSMKEAACNAVNAVIQWFAGLPGRLWEWLCNTISKVSEFAGNLGSKALEAGKDFCSNLIDAVVDLPSKFMDIGKHIVTGVWEGICGMASWIKERVTGFFKGIVKGARDAMDINSPSRVMRDQVGKYMAMGVGVGFEDEAKSVEDSIDKNLHDMVSKLDIDDVSMKLTTAVYAEQAAINSKVGSTNIYNSYVSSTTNPGNGKAREGIVIHNVTNLDGKVIAETTAPYMDTELGDIQNSKERGGR